MTVGQRLWVYTHQGYRAVTIASVGRQYATLTHNDGRVSLAAGNHYEGGRYGTYASTATDAEYVAIRRNDLAIVARSRMLNALAAADHPTVQRVCEALGIDCPELPTAESILGINLADYSCNPRSPA